ncbi:MAG TPA: hypothetical protein GXX28_00965 [Firmicutes bacterium]|nr:hypothetical protein [Bacillota bacterium]
MSQLVCKFRASLPAIQSAVSVSGNGDGARVKLDIPESDLAEAMKLMLLRGVAFTVTVEVEADAVEAPPSM